MRTVLGIDRLRVLDLDEAAVEKVRRNLDVFARMLREARFDTDDPMTGLEVELNLIDDRGDPALERIVRAALETHRAGLGHAVADGHLGHAHPLDDLLHHLDRAR